MSNTEALRARLLAHAAIHDAETSPYSPEQAQWAADLREAAAALAQQPAASGEPVAWRVQLEGLWFHARDREGLIAAIGVKLGRSISPEQVEPLYAAPQPAPARVPLTGAEIASMQRKANTTGVQFLQPSTVRWIVRAIEAAHGITAQGEPK